MFFFQAEDGIRDHRVTGVQTCALPILTELVQQTVQSVQTTQNNTVQTTAAPVEEAKPTTLEGVFQQLIDRSGAWQNFKMLDRGKLAAFQRSMTDSINGVRSQLVAEKQKVKENEVCTMLPMRTFGLYAITSDS